MSKYWGIPLIGRILKALNVSTPEQLSALSISQLASVKGVGPAKIRAILDLVKNVQKSTTKREATPVLLFTRSTDLAEYADLDALSNVGVVSVRIRSVIKDNKIATLGELADWHANVNIKDVPNYGRKSHQEIDDILQDIKMNGVEKRIFLSHKTPETGDEFFRAMIATIRKDQARDIFTKYFVQGQGIESIAAGLVPSVTRQRVHQVIDHTIMDYTDSWGPTALHLLEPLLDLASEMGGVVPTPLAMEVTKTKSPNQIMILGLVSQTPLYIPSGELNQGIVVEGSTDTFYANRKQISGILDGIVGNGIDRQKLRTELSALGYNIPDAYLAPWVSRFCRTNLIEDPTANVVFFIRARTLSCVNDALRSLKGPYGIHDITECVNTKYGTELSARNTTLHLTRNEDAYKANARKWIHIDNIPFTRDQIDEVATAAKKLIPRNGQAVSVRRILAEVSAAKPIASQMDPFWVRTALLRLGDVRSWRSGCDVAWDTPDARRTHIDQHLTEYLDTCTDVFSIAEMAEEVSAMSGYLTSSVLVQIPTDKLITIGHDSHISIKAAFPTRVEFETAVREVGNCVPRHDLTSDVVLADDVVRIYPHFKPLVAKWGTGIIFGLAKHHAEIDVRLLGRVIWAKSLASSDVKFIFDHVISGKFHTFSPRDIQTELQRRYKIVYHNYTVRLLGEMMDLGYIHRPYTGIYKLVSEVDGQYTFGF